MFRDLVAFRPSHRGAQAEQRGHHGRNDGPRRFHALELLLDGTGQAPRVEDQTVVGWGWSRTGVWCHWTRKCAVRALVLVPLGRRLSLAALRQKIVILKEVFVFSFFFFFFLSAMKSRTIFLVVRNIRF